MINVVIGDVYDGDVIFYHRSVYSVQIMAVVVETPCIDGSSIDGLSEEIRINSMFGFNDN
jgi:hypothetical protein